MNQRYKPPGGVKNRKEEMRSVHGVRRRTLRRYNPNAGGVQAPMSSRSPRKVGNPAQVIACRTEDTS